MFWEKIGIMVLSFMMLFSFIQMGIAERNVKIAAKFKTTDKKAERLYNIALWKLAIVMIIKVNLENHLGMPKTMPVLWFVDMLIMNIATIMLVLKYFVKLNKNR